MTVRIYNTLARDKQDFVPQDPNRVLFYSCGPTVYGEFHVGNARTFVMGDVVRRWLMASGFKVIFAQNITDVDDKIIDKAAQEGTSAEEVAQRYTTYFLDKLKELGNLPADFHPKATQHIGQMVAMIRKLADKGHAYATEDGSVWFNVPSFADYGKLSRRPLDQMQQGERVDPTMQARKKSPLDFALWKASKPGEPAWKSPWGEGRPGWHIECSCMSMKALGAETIDLHAGGSDLMFPHHENEIAQSEAATGKPFSKYWMHFGMLDIDGEKMSKSLGNFKRLDDLFTVIDPLTLRYFFMSARYRDKLDYTDDNIHKCRSAVDRMVNAMRTARTLLGSETAGDFHSNSELEALWVDFSEGMNDDFNTPRALGALAQAVTALNTVRTTAEQSRNLDALRQVFTLVESMRSTLGLGIEMERPDTELSEEQLAALAALLQELSPAPVSTKREANALMAALIELRTASRKAKDFAKADLIRQRLTAIGVTLEDKPGSTAWKKG